tara:strand:+ start:9083 stop:9247 length:165 start_codon:yes stop_codon:yes gene_type:complete
MKKVIVSIWYENKYYWTLSLGKVLPNGKTIVSKSVIDKLLDNAKVKRGQTYSKQ